MNILASRILKALSGFILGFILLGSGNIMGQTEFITSRLPGPTTSTPLSGAQKEEIHQLVNEYVSDSNIGRVRDDLNSIMDYYKWMTLILVGVVSAIAALQFYLRHNELLRIIEKERPKIIKQLIEGATKDLGALIEIDALQYRLFRQLDIDEPSMRHPLSKDVETVIKHYLKRFYELKEKIKGVTLTSLDYERQGDAYHYLAGGQGPKLSDKERIDYEMKAIGYYKQALEILGEPGLEGIKANLWTHQIIRKLGNAFAGTKKYDLAIAQYREITQGYSTNDPRVWLSWGDALQGLYDYEQAVMKYDKAIVFSEKNRQHGSIYWEALYQKGNALSALGDYNTAKECYKKNHQRRTDHQIWIPMG